MGGAAAGYGSYLYWLGGADGGIIGPAVGQCEPHPYSIDTITSTVFYAMQHEDGTLGTWQPTTPLPQSFANAEGVGGQSLDVPLVGSAVALDGYLYAFTGIQLGTTSNGCPTSILNRAVVFGAPINADGSLGSWTMLAEDGGLYGGPGSTIDLTSGAPAVAANNAGFFFLNGMSRVDGGLGSLFVPIASPGKLGAGIASFPPPTGTTGDGVVIAYSWGNQLYAVGPSGSLYSLLDGGSAGGFSNWLDTTTCPGCAAGTGYESFIFALEDTTENGILVSAVGDNGVLGAWTATTPLPEFMNSVQFVPLNGWMYSVGGQGTNVVYYARIQ